MAKRVNVILAFHAHEPLWELPRHILHDVEDEEMKSAVQSVNWVKKRAREGRDIYASLLDFARKLGVPVVLEATNELLVQLAQVQPATFAELGDAYRDGTIYPVYGNAHHSHISLLTEAELSDEIRLNREFVHGVLGAPHPKYRGYFPSEDSLDASKLGGIKTAGIDFVVFPHLDRRKSQFRAEGAADFTYSPFTIGDGIIALPRHFPISQEIWRPITRMEPENLTVQGYLLGEYWVLPEEYRRKKQVPFPISYEEAVAEYRQTLEKAVESAPDGGLLLYIQDLELMDFGDIALEIMRDSWEQVLASDGNEINFVTPDEYLDEVLLKSGKRLGHLKFNQISWAPEIRLVLRSDGHYPPLGAGKFQGLDSDREIFRKWPFIFWETGRYIVETCNWLLRSFGFPLEIGADAVTLKKADYRFPALSQSSQLALHARLIKRACNWGWQPDESRHKWPYLHAYAIATELLQVLRALGEADEVEQRLFPAPMQSFKGLSRLPEVIVDTRIEYLKRGLAEQTKSWRMTLDTAFAELDRAKSFRHEALDHLREMDEALQAVRLGQSDFQQSFIRFLEGFRAHCKAMFMALDHIQRAWAQTPSVDDMVTTMYRYLYELFPPKFPEILEDTLTDAETEARRKPKLL